MVRSVGDGGGLVVMLDTFDAVDIADNWADSSEFVIRYTVEG
jgi:hypothetical protein